MSRDNLVFRLNQLEIKRKKIIRAFSDNSPLIIGTVTRTKGRCGKPNCKCAQKPSHDITLLLTTVDGVKKSQLVRKHDIDEIYTQWENYRMLRKMLKELKTYNMEVLQIMKKITLCRKRSYKPT